VLRRVEVEYSEGRVAQEEVRFVVVHSSQLAQQHAQTYAGAQGKEAEAIADHVRQVQAQWFACWPDAEAAIAAYEQHLANLRRKDLLPQLRTDLSICRLGRLFCLELCGFCL
jgi:hypothetical protein